MYGVRDAAVLKQYVDAGRPTAARDPHDASAC
jgi:hypothetical protein